MSRDKRTLPRQRGELNLLWVGVGSVVLAGAGMLAMMSMRTERNLFEEAAGKVKTAVGASAAVDAARQNLPGSQMRKCVINGKTVVSNEDCEDDNPTSRDIRIQTTRGVEAPRVPKAAKADPRAGHGSDPAVDKLIEKQTE